MSQDSLFATEVHGGRHDELTGLLNCRAYEERLPVEIARANRYAWPLSLCLLDLDGFKRINDTLGHPAGDRALQQVAALIDESPHRRQLPHRRQRVRAVDAENLPRGRRRGQRPCRPARDGG
jgi:PleD family two-component response regulator